jgi:chorismate mutase
MLEVHIDPDSALSDAKQQLTPQGYTQLLSKIIIKKVGSEDEDFKQQIKMLRQEIDSIDDQIIELLAKRMNNSKKIAFHKMSHKISLFQPDRFEEVAKRWVEEGRNLSGDLSEEFIAKLYHFIHEESLRVQEKALSD